MKPPRSDSHFSNHGKSFVAETESNDCYKTPQLYCYTLFDFAYLEAKLTNG